MVFVVHENKDNFCEYCSIAKLPNSPNTNFAKITKILGKKETIHTFCGGGGHKRKGKAGETRW
jgi:hypothetical protein